MAERPGMTTAKTSDVRSRIERLKAEAMERNGSVGPAQNPHVLNVALWRAMRPGRSRVQVRAAFLLEQVRLARIEIGPRWRLAGDHLPRAVGGWPVLDPAEAQTVADLTDLGAAAEEIPDLCRQVQQWRGASMGSPTGAAMRQWCSLGDALPDADLGRGSWRGEEPTHVFIAGGWSENHSIRDYAKLLRVGFGGIGEEARQLLDQADIAAADTARRENFWRAALHVCEAGAALGRRYAERARQMAERATDAAERARLTRMAETCSRVPARGARTFFEAVQALWFGHVLTCGEDGINANSLGRLDKILYPYYRADVDAGRLGRDEAAEIMAELACKLYQHYDVQAIVLGGQDAEGRDAVNELSYVILEATRDVGLIRDVSIRLHRDSPADFVDLSAELIARGGGVPFIFNDECFIPALHARGIELADARDYAPIGCIELTIPGKAIPHAVSGWLNAAKCLELAFFDGRDPRADTQLGPTTGLLTDHASFEALYAAYARQVDCFSRRMVYGCNRGELAQREYGPLPLWSVLTDDCIARGRDITDGGAVYNYHSVCLTGAANAADSLMAVKKLIFDDGRMSAGDLLAALRGNFAGPGQEAVRQMLLRGAPKYGNDVAEVDDIARRVCADFIALMDTMRSPLGGRYFVHLFSFLLNIPFGKSVGATPDGRKAGEPLAYSLSAHQGRDESGVTAMLQSLARMPHDRAAAASAAIVELDEKVVQGGEGAQRLAELIRSAIAMGVGQLQWNVTSVERLRLAQQDPEHYGNIAVRVAGYSQMFMLINKELQDHIIARTKHKG